MDIKPKYYTDAAGKWRWNLTNPKNGKIFGASHQGFDSLSNAKRNFKLNQAVRS